MILCCLLIPSALPSPGVIETLNDSIRVNNAVRQHSSTVRNALDKLSEIARYRTQPYDSECQRTANKLQQQSPPHVLTNIQSEMKVTPPTSTKTLSEKNVQIVNNVKKDTVSISEEELENLKAGLSPIPKALSGYETNYIDRFIVPFFG